MACEGTRFTEKKRMDSMKYAQEKNLPQLKYHIIPRTRGLTLILHGAKGKSEPIFIRMDGQEKEISAWTSSSGCIQFHVGLYQGQCSTTIPYITQGPIL